MVVFGGYLGLLLLGAAFIAIGVFASTCTRHQLLAALIGVAVLSVFTFVVDYGAEFATETWLREVCVFMNVLGHYSDFAKGVLDSGPVIFFISIALFFLVMASKLLESRRWR
jgi:ABC-2 type transport system permease protein